MAAVGAIRRRLLPDGGIQWLRVKPWTCCIRATQSLKIPTLTLLVLVRCSWLGHFSCRLRHRDGNEDAQSEEDDDRCDSTLAGRGGATVRA